MALLPCRRQFLQRGRFQEFLFLRRMVRVSVLKFLDFSLLSPHRMAPPWSFPGGRFFPRSSSPACPPPREWACACSGEGGGSLPTYSPLTRRLAPEGMLRIVMSPEVLLHEMQEQAAAARRARGEGVWRTWGRDGYLFSTMRMAACLIWAAMELRALALVGARWSLVRSCPAWTCPLSGLLPAAGRRAGVRIRR